MVSCIQMIFNHMLHVQLKCSQAHRGVQGTNGNRHNIVSICAFTFKHLNKLFEFCRLFCKANDESSCASHVQRNLVLKRLCDKNLFSFK